MSIFLIGDSSRFFHFIRFFCKRVHIFYLRPQKSLYPLKIQGTQTLKSKYPDEEIPNERIVYKIMKKLLNFYSACNGNLTAAGTVSARFL